MKEVWDSCRERGVDVDLEIAGGKAAIQDEIETRAPAQTQDHSAVPGNANPGSAQTEATSHEDTAPAVSVQAPSSQSLQTPAPAPVPAVIPPQTIPVQLPITESPSESVWLDRAIIGVVIALVLLILRRVSNVDEL
jgi:ubiquitin-conjugating enzyme E2 J1